MRPSESYVPKRLTLHAFNMSIYLYYSKSSCQRLRQRAISYQLHRSPHNFLNKCQDGLSLPGTFFVLFVSLFPSVPELFHSDFSSLLVLILLLLSFLNLFLILFQKINIKLIPNACVVYYVPISLLVSGHKIHNGFLIDATGHRTRFELMGQRRGLFIFVKGYKAELKNLYSCKCQVQAL